MTADTQQTDGDDEDSEGVMVEEMMLIFVVDVRIFLWHPRMLLRTDCI